MKLMREYKYATQAVAKAGAPDRKHSLPRCKSARWTREWVLLDSKLALSMTVRKQRELRALVKLVDGRA
jgi:hypothetical protein